MLRLASAACLVGAFVVATVGGGIEGGASAKKVKVQASVGKADDQGNQVITVKVTVDPGWYIYANPVEHNKDNLNRNKTTLAISSKVKLDAIKIEYPPGKLKKDDGNEFKIYEGDATIRATIRRAKGDSGPLEWSLEVNACNAKVCLPPGVVTFATP